MIEYFMLLFYEGGGRILGYQGFMVAIKVMAVWRVLKAILPAVVFNRICGSLATVL